MSNEDSGKHPDRLNDYTKIKNFMKSVKQEFVENHEHVDNTIDTLHDLVRDSFKNLVEEQDKKLAAVAGSLKQEIATLKTYTAKSASSMSQFFPQPFPRRPVLAAPPAPAPLPLAPAPGPAADSRSIQLTWNSDVTFEQVQKVVFDHKPFADWAARNIPNQRVTSIHVSAVGESSVSGHYTADFELH